MEILRPEGNSILIIVGRYPLFTKRGIEGTNKIQSMEHLDPWIFNTFPDEIG